MEKIIHKLIRRLNRKMAIKFGLQIQKHAKAISRASLPKFANTPENLLIELPRRIINPDRMFIGNDVSIGPDSFFIAMTHYPTKNMEGREKPERYQTFDSKIVIGDRVTATANLQIAAQKEIIIEDDVMFASNIHINDGLHGYSSAETPYKSQPIIRISPIVIKKGCWIGQNVIVFPGVTIGENCVVGANSVVTRSIPNQCIAIGNPARVIKKWDRDKQEWLSTDSKS